MAFASFARNGVVAFCQVMDDMVDEKLNSFEMRFIKDYKRPAITYTDL
jgi:hypothetical protein